MTAIAGTHARSEPPTDIRTQPNYPFLVLLAYLPFILYMHRSKIGPRGLDLDGANEYAIYFHADMALYVLVAFLLWLAKPMRRWSLAIMTPLYYLATFDWLSWHTQSKSFFFGDLYRALQLIVYYPEFVSELPGGFKARAIILLGLPLMLALTFRLSWPGQLAQKLRRPLNAFCGLLVVVALIPAPWLLSSKYMHQNSIAHMLADQLYDRALDNIDADRKSMKAVLGHDNGAPPDVIKVAGQASTRDNVIIFIIETAPYPQYPDLGELAATLEHPWLKNNSITFTHHYGTYPASDRATYSILSGLYPPMLHHNKWKESMRYGDSLPKALAKHGYTSYLFSTAPLSFYDDDVMFRNLGFDHLREVENTRDLRIKTENGYQWDRSRLYDMDKELIQMVVETLGRHAQEGGSPFLAAVSPQASHAPFNCPPEYREHPDACSSDLEKLRINAQWQFGLIEHLIKELDAMGMLDSTLLVITGDHGVRSKHESAAFFQNPNLLQQSTFHLPLMLASSRFGDKKAQVGQPTSHVDIAPTVLDLLGISRNDVYFHGRNLFANSPRSIYFIGTGYSPVTGFLLGGRYYMENRSNSLFLSAPQMHFEDRRHVTGNEETQDFVTQELLRLEAFLRREYLQMELH